VVQGEAVTSTHSIQVARKSNASSTVPEWWHAVFRLSADFQARRGRMLLAPVARTGMGGYYLADKNTAEMQT